ncbi:MAG: hypothetical protein JKY66_00170 [Spongiibacteraceae bacterium]|nr:hypothetical protein [Spongiibacteraceae bacterium]
MSNDVITNILLASLVTSSLGIFIWIGFVFYLKSKWIPFVEDILENGHRFHSLNIFLAGHGSLSYATVFFSKRHAKRMQMLETRDKVPKNVQRLFIIGFYFFMFNFFLFFGTAAVVYLMKDVL